MWLQLGESSENLVDFGFIQNLSPRTVLIIVGTPVAGVVAGMIIFAVVLLSSESEHRADMIRAAGGAFRPRR
ncbi:hypothetical protein DLJ59_15920 [Micromonospora inaquosa]|uniref:Uncharacterized protein n=1 Tax=Micromonospora inaquosa TaxID=2203716 RepID=A0A3N9WN88_9ACTN|nr:hypothetical protein DLJ59_15920 [Micromonospora inaquosa]